MVPASLSIWMQRAGRAGRNFLIAARAILLVQPSVFKEVNTKNPTDDVTFQKSVEAGLRAWIETKECRREVVDEYFDNGTPRMCMFPSTRSHLYILTKFQLRLAFAATIVCANPHPITLSSQHDPLAIFRPRCRCLPHSTVERPISKELASALRNGGQINVRLFIAVVPGAPKLSCPMTSSLNLRRGLI